MSATPLPTGVFGTNEAGEPYITSVQSENMHGMVDMDEQGNARGIRVHNACGITIEMWGPAAMARIDQSRGGHVGIADFVIHNILPCLGAESVSRILAACAERRLS